MTGERWHLHARPRLAASAVAFVLTAVAAPPTGSTAIRLVLAFDAAACVYLALAWHLILSTSAEETRRRAAMDDPGRRMVFTVVLGSGVAVLAGGMLLLRGSAALSERMAEMLLGITVSAVVLAWALTHTAFALHYAHLYYRDAGTDEAEAATPGLLFPGGEDPDDLDFAYLAFTVGMTFQVSDVQVTSSRFRRAILGQGVLAFAYNTIIVALVLNLIFAQLQVGRR